MEVAIRKSAVSKRASGPIQSNTLNQYRVSSKKTTLSMYAQPPQEEITLDHFERSGVDRLQAFKSLENLRAKRQLSAKNDDGAIRSILSQYHLEDDSWDNLSHFVLRLAYCKSEELRRWLIQQECLLFKYRFDSEKEEIISAFFKENNMSYEPIEDLDLDLRDLLRQVPFAEPNQNVYYKVPFEDAIDLIRDRKVFLHGGWAYVSRTNLSSIIVARFRSHLSNQLAMTYRATSNIKQDARIAPLISMMAKQYITPTYKAGHVEGAVTKDQLPTLSDRSFPLCMSNLMTALKAENHLKHGGRMQLGLFLKGIGLSLADALAFWKQSFMRRTPPEKFDKEYAYNIRHNYGKEGKRTTYTPYGCVKIIQGQPGAGDHHGCPFRLWEDSTLRAKMRTKGVPQQQIDEIVTLVKGQHYQIACQRYYQATHNNVLADGVGNHPNAYFDASETYWREKQGAVKSETGVKQEPTTSSTTSSSNIKTEAEQSSQEKQEEKQPESEPMVTV